MALEPMSNEVARLVNKYRRLQEERRRAQARLETRRKIIRWLAFFGLLFLCFGLWKGPRWYREYAKRRMAFRFLKAVLSKDGQTLFELTSPEERKQSALTPEKAVAVTERLLAYLGEVKPIRVEIETPPPKPKGEVIVEGLGGSKYLIIYPNNPTFPEERTWIVYWGDKEGKLLPSWWAQAPDKSLQEKCLTSQILIVKLKSGFWVDFGYFVLSTCFSKWGEREGLRMTERIWREANLAVK